MVVGRIVALLPTLAAALTAIWQVAVLEVVPSVALTVNEVVPTATGVTVMVDPLKEAVAIDEDGDEVMV